MTTDTQKAERNKKLRQIASKLSKMTPAELAATAAQMPIVTCEGRTLSLHNQAFLALQAGHRTITMIGGYRQWMKQGRAVTRAEHACGSIFVPLVDHPAAGDEMEDEPGGVRFILVPVFDVSQTHEILLPEKAHAAGG